jgi:hypothetical protein
LILALGVRATLGSTTFPGDATHMAGLARPVHAGVLALLPFE